MKTLSWKVHISAAAVVADGLISNFSPPLCLLIIPICHDLNLLEEGCCGGGRLSLKQNVDGAWNGVAQLQSHDVDDDDDDDDEGEEEDDGGAQTQNHPHQ